MFKPSRQLPSIYDLPLPSLQERFFLEMEEVAARKLNSGPKADPRHGTWTREEDELLRMAVSNCRPILWDVVAESVPGRSAIQCKERWLYRLDPEVKRTRFEKWEDDLIVRERLRIGNHWTVIANKLPGRTPCAVKNRWYSCLRNLAPETKSGYL